MSTATCDQNVKEKEHAMKMVKESIDIMTDLKRKLKDCEDDEVMTEVLTDSFTAILQTHRKYLKILRQFD